VQRLQPEAVRNGQPPEAPVNSCGWSGGRKHCNSRRRVEAFAAWDLRYAPAPNSPDRHLLLTRLRSLEPTWRLRPQTGPITPTRTARFPLRASGHAEAFGVELEQPRKRRRRIQISQRIGVGGQHWRSSGRKPQTARFPLTHRHQR
jgi:hypothetical protein